VRLDPKGPPRPGKDTAGASSSGAVERPRKDKEGASGFARDRRRARSSCLSARFSPSIGTTACRRASMIGRPARRPPRPSTPYRDCRGALRRRCTVQRGQGAPTGGATSCSHKRGCAGGVVAVRPDSRRFRARMIHSGDPGERTNHVVTYTRALPASARVKGREVNAMSAPRRSDSLSVRFSFLGDQIGSGRRSLTSSLIFGPTRTTC